jgi:hypothetical protein
MANKISFKEFMDQVEKNLKDYSPDALRSLLTEWAKDTPQAGRNEFLARLTPAPIVPTTPKPDDTLLAEIDQMAEDVDHGAYVDGWGWDDEICEERDFGDESWMDEADEFFSRAHTALTEGHYILARDAYARLFDILDMGEEPGHLPGVDIMHNLPETDLDEARSAYIRAVYLSSTPQERPAAVLDAIQRFDYYISVSLNLHSVIDVEQKPLPDMDRFLPAWIEMLKNNTDRRIGFLLREAVLLSGGIPAIAEFARAEVVRYPEAYVDWIKALEKTGNFPAMLQAAKEGLSAVPPDYAVRAEIAEGLRQAAAKLQDRELQLMGWREAFYSDPCLDYLLPLLSAVADQSSYYQEIEAAINRLISLRSNPQNSGSRSFTTNSGPRQSAASLDLLNQAYLLAGRYEDARQLCTKEQTDGIYEKGPSGLLIPFLLVYLSKKDLTQLTPNLDQFWKKAVEKACIRSKQGLGEDFNQAMDRVLHRTQLTPEEENRYLTWCTKETGERIDAILKAKFRDSYGEAANQLLALSEVLANRNRKSDGLILIEKFRQKYSRFHAFQSELKEARGKSGFFSS